MWNTFARKKDPVPSPVSEFKSSVRIRPITATDLISMFTGNHPFHFARAMAEMEKLNEFPELTNALIRSFSLNACKRLNNKLSCNTEYVKLLLCTTWGEVVECLERARYAANPTMESCAIHIEIDIILFRAARAIPSWLNWWKNDMRGSEGNGPLAISTCGNIDYIYEKLDNEICVMDPDEIVTLHSNCKALAVRITELSRKPIQVGKYDHGEIVVAEQVNN